MAFDYSDMAATAKELIDEFGRDVTLVREERVADNPANSFRSLGATGTPDTLPVKAVIMPFEAREVDGTTIQAFDNRAYVAATDTDPEEVEKYDTLQDSDSTEWNIVSKQLYNPGDTRLLYELQLRR